MKFKQWATILDVLREAKDCHRREAAALQNEIKGYEKQLMDADTPNQERDIASAEELAKTKYAAKMAKAQYLQIIISEIENKEV